ncbi:hypothetical protein [Pirellulimonas nuda]|uniref:hypothetical protein n=1 Tax=Pirellulimonas nuda TaxID=2528009 RepID=UPI0018D2A7F8|nr:hypothetical protein [Pirellulimonas nuda]
MPNRPAPGRWGKVLEHSPDAVPRSRSGRPIRGPSSTSCEHSGPKAVVMKLECVRAAAE